MAKDPRAGELTTTNYGWTKPTVGGSDDVWGDQINANLDGIDSVIHGIDTRPVPVGGAIPSDTPPANPTPGMLWFDSVSGQTYVWFSDANSSQWVIAVNAASALQPASTTVLGGVKVDGTTIKAATDGTISTTVVPLGDNRIINGDMRIDQRNNGAVTTPASGAFAVDRWKYQSTQSSKISFMRLAAGGGLSVLGFGNYLNAGVTTAFSPAATDFFFFTQPIEADMITDFAWGTPNAQPVTVSFLAYASVTGTFAASIAEPSGTIFYPFTYSLPTAATWTKIVVTIPGATAGTWTLQGNGVGASLRFDLGSGANFRAPAGAWTTTNAIGANGAANFVTTQGANFNITGVKLEIGTVATPFNRQSLAKSWADCQRYYQVLANICSGYNAAGQTIYSGYNFLVSMRAAPTVVFSSITATNASALNTSGIFNTSVNYQVTATALGFASASFISSFNAEL